VVVTPRLRERAGQYLREGDVICVVEDASAMEAEVKLPEQEAARVRPGQAVSLKARSLPFETFRGTVLRKAPVATSKEGDVQGTVTIYCRVADPPPDLDSGMSGHARIRTGRTTAGRAGVERAVRFLRTEFWW
jgi:multidrug efflux pump subunit AcrA (membrane-fusion protein)